MRSSDNATAGSSVISSPSFLALPLVLPLAAPTPRIPPTLLAACCYSSNRGLSA
jgi:hypothetical protein